MKYSILVLILSVFYCSTVKEVKRDNDLKGKLSGLKRIAVAVPSASKLTKMEQLFLAEVSKDQIAAKKDFIVFRSPDKFKGGCTKDNPKIEGVFQIDSVQEEKGNSLKIQLNSSLIDCRDGKTVWSAVSAGSFSADSRENESLRKTYTQKFGLGIESRVNPYFRMINEMLEELESPVLNESEKDEKIEADSV
ncbi:MAG TPA: MXAN_6521/LA_1396 family lipoprotein [Leptospiraceae bacterium]|nr:MXAN_6521/LA_1396 family lipoprotein [Leptospiraceae bacterium]